MRRKDRAMSKSYAREIIDGSRYGVLSMIDGDEAYGLPLSIVREGRKLYFHSAKEGRKVDILKANPRVSVAFVGQVSVPENFTIDELDQMSKDSSKAGLFISSVFTTQFQSAIASGKVTLIEDEKEKVKAMKLICEKYTPSKMKYFDMAIKSGINRTNVYMIEIEELSAKRKKYDDRGEEMKWQRME